MDEKYLEYLKEEYRKAEIDFENMKNNIMNDVPGQELYQTDEFGDTCASRIIKLTNITTKLKTLEENITMLESYNKQLQ